MHELINKVKTSFKITFGYDPNYIIQAPGRVNLIGEHTDYNEGFVLPCAINYQIIVTAAKRSDSMVRVVSVDYGNDFDEFDIKKDIIFKKNKMWANYIRGVVLCLLKRGCNLGGVDISVGGNVPQGAGLSSSAALEVVIGQTFKELFNLAITQAEIALNGKKAESEFVGCNCGVMDQMISATAIDNHATLLDCRNLTIEPVPIPENISVIIINSNVKRDLVDSEYNFRRQQCEEVAHFFGVKALRDVTIEDFNANSYKLNCVLTKRARHIITENHRTIEAAKALSKNDMKRMGTLMAQSHESMKNDFEITISEIDFLVEIVKDIVGERGGARMTGGGFGGCVVALVPLELVDTVMYAVKSRYKLATGIDPSVYICKAKQGAGLLATIL
ncbi:galactokinase [Plesiomonas shigelloides]|uniref:galactokinase n=1 Tax=Plesiomonas shigelloides TaxID=703 RepID=UPI002247E47B|nr:galactokinase [Plesiomonas shigelloides]MCX2497488.1 galactokinase [Plesiomonas shigelloides]MCX2534842.1 galactokinase [Plesiomonas shigelloides]